MNSFLKSDLLVLDSMVRWVSPDSQQVGEIWRLFKEYNNPTARYPIFGSCNCGHSVQDYFAWLRAFRSENAHKFINPVEEVFKPLSSYKKKR